MTTIYTPEKLAELKAVAEKATPGPYLAEISKREYTIRTNNGRWIERDHIDLTCWAPESPDDYQFIAAACTHFLPQIAEIERMTADVERLKNANAELGDMVHDAQNNHPLLQHNKFLAEKNDALAKENERLMLELAEERAKHTLMLAFQTDDPLGFCEQAAAKARAALKGGDHG